MEDNKHPCAKIQVLWENSTILASTVCDFSKNIMSEKFQHKVVNTQGHPTSTF